MTATNHPAPLDAGVARIVGELDDDRREAFEERAGILEFDARLPRKEAELLAIVDTLARHGFPGIPPVCLLQADIDGATEWLLTGNAITARRALAERGVVDVVEVDLADTLRRQFADLAVLSIAQ